MPDEKKLIGLARLMKLAFDGTDLTPLGDALIQRAKQDPEDAEALMDLSIVLQLREQSDLAVKIQAQALTIKTLYHLPAKRNATIRLLAIMAPGDITTNAPLEFLVEDSDISLDMLYVAPGLPLPPELPEHDLLFVAAGESTGTRPILPQLIDVMKTWPRPVLNLPENILKTSREEAPIYLSTIPKLYMPPSFRSGRDQAKMDFPVIIRPLDSHAGHGLAKIDNAAAMESYFASRSEEAFYISPFIDYRNEDGLYRKYRIVLIAGRPYACHMGISENWMIHYVNAGMFENEEKRKEEAHFMRDFDTDFAVRHHTALKGIYDTMGLDYLVIDCGETRNGDLLIFEIDTGAVIHNMDPVDLFPYKAPQMKRVFSAFRDMLLETVRAGV